jgi:hypothetical protein
MDSGTCCSTSVVHTQYAGLLDFDGGKDAPAPGKLNSTHVAKTLNFFFKLKKIVEFLKKTAFFTETS